MAVVLQKGGLWQAVREVWNGGGVMGRSVNRQIKQQVAKGVDSEALQPLLCMVDVCKVLKLSRPKIYALMNEGLPVIRFGRALRFSPTSLQAWLKQREEIA